MSAGSLSRAGTGKRLIGLALMAICLWLISIRHRDRLCRGTCFGDSGGPNFIGSSNVIGGVTSFGINGNCAGTGGVYRVDQADDLAWLATFF